MAGDDPVSGGAAPGDDPGPGVGPAVALDLAARLHAVEQELEGLRAELRTRRLVVVDAAGRDRLVAEAVDDVAEVRLDLPGQPPPQRAGALLFAIPGRDGLAGGAGLQLWAAGSVVRELTWWEDDELRPDGR